MVLDRITIGIAKNPRLQKLAELCYEIGITPPERVKEILEDIAEKEIEILEQELKAKVEIDLLKEQQRKGGKKNATKS